MRRQKYALKTKEYDKISEKELKETEIKQSDKEFKVVVIKMLTSFEEGVDELGENLKEEMKIFLKIRDWFIINEMKKYTKRNQQQIRGYKCMNQ